MGIGKLLTSITINKDVISENTKKLKENFADSSKTVKETIYSTSNDVSTFFTLKKDDLKESFSTVKDNISKVLDTTINAKNKKFDEIAGFHLKVQKLYSTVQEVVKKLETDKAFFNYIITLSAIGIAVANADGEISNEEQLEIDEFIGGISSSYYPDFVKETIQKIKENPPTFTESLIYLERLDVSSFESVRNLIEVIILSDDYVHEDEKAFLVAFDLHIKQIKINQNIEAIKYINEGN